MLIAAQVYAAAMRSHLASMLECSNSVHCTVDVVRSKIINASKLEAHFLKRSSWWCLNLANLTQELISSCFWMDPSKVCASSSSQCPVARSSRATRSDVPVRTHKTEESSTMTIW